MRTIIKEIKIYTFKEATPELRDKIRENFDYEYNLYDFCMEERVASLKSLASRIEADLDYSLSCVPDRGEYIRMTPSENTQELYEEFRRDSKDCPLTGIYYDEELRQVGKTLDECLSEYINSIHDEYESMLSDEYLLDLCEANDYEFTEDGKIY